VVLADAFSKDPVWSRLVRDLPQPEQTLKAVFETPIRYCLRYGDAYATSANIEGVAAWVSGDRADMTFWRMVRSGALASGMRLGMKLARRMEPLFRPLQADRKVNMSGRPYMYLQVIGVATRFQGRGFGRGLLAALIEKGERRGVHLYLETETEPNVRMYERHGFRVVKSIILPGLELPMWEMVREPRRGTAETPRPAVRCGLTSEDSGRIIGHDR